jgi:glycosyltransferase involved in cell wall biosynthesis
MSLVVPNSLRCVIMHHGCAQTHWDRDPDWRDAGAQKFCDDQGEMYRRPNRWFVAAAQWTAEQFSAHYDVPVAPVLPNWVAPMPRLRPDNERPVILGDWRTFNKGSGVIDALRAARPDLEFRPLRCEHDERPAFYGVADAYLCLSLSEGGAYSVADAEATSLPLVTTDVGNVFEYTSSIVIPWQQRDDVATVSAALDKALALERSADSSFYAAYDLKTWTAGWRDLLQTVADTPVGEKRQP